MNHPPAFINALGCAVPDHDVHQDFIAWAERQLADPREQRLFRRMAQRSGIDHRWSVLPRLPEGKAATDPGGFYGAGQPPTSVRMDLYAEAAPALAMRAVEALAAKAPLDGLTHLVVASCTGFVAPGIDQRIAEALGCPEIERVLVGFMGCYAAVAALRSARHIVRSEPAARVLVVTVELSTLHLQAATNLEPLLAMLQFADGAGAALVTAQPDGFAIGAPIVMALPASQDLIRWTIGDTGFAMHLSGEVPARIRAALRQPEVRARLMAEAAHDPVWAVHAGGQSILDAVEDGLDLASDALAASRRVLARFGNMSSSTLMFVLDDLLGDPAAQDGVALAFGPGLAVEGFHFGRAP